MTPQELQVIEERSLHASPSPWEAYYSFWTLNDGEERIETGVNRGEGFPSLSASDADARFLAKGRDDLPFLVTLAEQRHRDTAFALSADTGPRLLQIRCRAESATAGEWCCRREEDTIAISAANGRHITTVRRGRAESATQLVWTAAFVAHCRADILALLEFLEPFGETYNLMP